MPRYRFAYTVETPLAATINITFTNGRFPVSLRFTDRIDDMHIRLDAVAEGEDWRAANESVMDDVISPVLDALALHRKAPAMLQNLMHVVKAENGVVRRAVVIEGQSEQRPV